MEKYSIFGKMGHTLKKALALENCAAFGTVGKRRRHFGKMRHLTEILHT